MANNTFEVFQYDRLTFIITPEKIIIRTSLNQSFYLSPKAHYWRRRIKMIEAMIRLDEIRDLNDLASWTGNGIDWVHTGQQYKVDNYTRRAQTV